MRRSNTPALRSSVFAVAALSVISALGWSFESYRNHLWERSNPTTAAVVSSEAGSLAA